MVVTGGAGFIGRHATAALVALGFDVHTVGRSPAAVPGATHHRIDLLQPGAAAAVADLRAGALLHLAWDVRHGLFWTSPENLDWVAASLLLYRAFLAGGGQRLVVAGSCAEYDWDHAWLDEATTPIRPATLYGTAKDALHRILRAAAGQDGISLAWGRLFFVYGPEEAPTRLVASVARALARGEPALCGPGTAERDFMRAEDAGAAFAALLDSAVDGPVNIATGQCVPIADIARILGRVAGRPDLVRLGARPPVKEPPRLAAATHRLQEQVGFRPALDLETGLAEAFNFWRAAESLLIT